MTLRWMDGGVTAAEGFVAAGVSAGIKRARKPDMALVVSETPATCAGTFTTNLIKAAPVVISQQRVKAGTARAILLNSGCANCMTGEAGSRDAVALSRLVAEQLGIAEGQILVASTGIIGRRLPVPRMRRAIPMLVQGLGSDGHQRAALGILTTDTVPKEAAAQATIGGRSCALGGMAKGAGMIMPQMATMLCALTTDAAVEPTLLGELLREAVEASFNRISIDGDMSTNDTVLLLANGRSGVAIRRGSKAAREFARMLHTVTQRLAYLIVKDGEGATRLAIVEVTGARSDAQALACARQIATSSLVRTMLASGDPNVGRIAAAAGASGAQFDPARLEVAIGAHVVIRRGVAQRLGKSLAKELLAPRELHIQVRLRAGRASSTMLMCDLTEAYVRLNARYPS